MNALNDLKKSIEIAEVCSGKLTKSQMALFGEPHHAAYTRTSASGKVSNVQAKGAQKTPQETLHGLKQHDYVTTFAGRLRHYGAEANVPYGEEARMQSALHATEVAHASGTQREHAKAHYEHVAAAEEASNPVYKLYHQEVAQHHADKMAELKTEEDEAVKQQVGPDKGAEHDGREAAYKRLSTRADELTVKADASNSSLDHDTARQVHNQAASNYAKGDPKKKYHIDMARYHSTRP